MKQSPGNRSKRNPNKTGFFGFAFLAVLLSANQLRSQVQVKPEKDYLVYALSEAADKISLIRFGPAGIRIDHELQTGDMPVDIDGPHGIAISPDKQFYYVSLAHGRPFGSVWKYSVKDDPGNPANCGASRCLQSGRH